MMKCPHCNQEYLEDYRFCPICGVGLDEHRTVEKQQEREYVFNPCKKMLSVEDFRHGNIIIDGVILGRTPLSELI